MLADVLRELGANVEAHATLRYRVRGQATTTICSALTRGSLILCVQTLLIATVTELLQGSDDTPYDVWPLPRRVIADKYLPGMVEQQIRQL